MYFHVMFFGIMSLNLIGVTINVRIYFGIFTFNAISISSSCHKLSMTLGFMIIDSDVFRVTKNCKN